MGELLLEDVVVLGRWGHVGRNFFKKGAPFSKNSINTSISLRKPSYLDAVIAARTPPQRPKVPLAGGAPLARPAGSRFLRRFPVAPAAPRLRRRGAPHDEPGVRTTIPPTTLVFTPAGRRPGRRPRPTKRVCGGSRRTRLLLLPVAAHGARFEVQPRTLARGTVVAAAITTTSATPAAAVAAPRAPTVAVAETAPSVRRKRGLGLAVAATPHVRLVRARGLGRKRNPKNYFTFLLCGRFGKMGGDIIVRHGRRRFDEEEEETR